MADILSQSEMNASNPAPRILPAVLKENKKKRNNYTNNYLTSKDKLIYISSKNSLD